jgi:hypothetical protein
VFKDENNKTYFETLDFFITIYRIDGYEYNITKDDYTKPLYQIKRFINSALKRHLDFIEQENLVNLME